MSNSSSKKSNWLFIAWAISVVATAGSLYLSEYLHFTPCSLCWYQRIFMYPMTILLGIASARNQTQIVPFVMPMVVIGGGFSIYHIFIQEMPHSGSVASCGPVSCMEDVLNAFGFLTVPMLALTAFVLIFIALLQIRRLDRIDSTKGPLL
ncbi:disulfide oxidoreductase [Cohnella silvisoli]|uniref:Disulfide oxidoreductase n=1 Tax=Cohnella silvisoli TaxID=2873699 RepID=A0ABV1L1N5_9BACL|nr:disulfide oxidoreductase [Cohnella silvisoli]MCD9025358.1 disulfide bond formation protein B [Cohnella silvisoli]